MQEYIKSCESKSWHNIFASVRHSLFGMYQDFRKAVDKPKLLQDVSELNERIDAS